MSSRRELNDVAIIGAGPAGLAAALFTARYGLTTRVFDRGPSLLKQCAYLDNYLGFPAGVDALEFLRLAKRHALGAGCVITPERVIGVERNRDAFVLSTQTAAFAAERVVVASGYDSDCLRGLAGVFDERGEVCADACGRTGCHGLYIAGPLAGVEDQALICAGHGARVALSLIGDARAARFPWPHLARHLDWQVRQGVYDSERWSARVHAYFHEQCRPDDAREREFRARVDAWIGDKRKQQIARGELARRRFRAARVRPSELP